jgi:Spy/CpxP family protein refolding chaperone
MKTNVKSLLTIVALTATSLVSNAALAQDAAKPAAPAANNNNGGDRRGGGGFEEFRKRMNDRIKTSLKVTDEEWTVLQPLIEKVTEKQRDAAGSRFGGFGGGPGGTRGGNNTGGNTAGGGTDTTRPERAGTAESTALRTALENESSSPEDIKAKLAAVREVRKKGTVELAAAREDLRKVVTVRQEAVLVSMGILE